MSTIRLVEYQNSDPIALSTEDVGFIRTELAKQFRISRPPIGDGFILNPRQYVGVVTLPSGQRIQCETKVPIANLGYMIATALDLPTFRRETAAFERIDEVLEQLASYFAELTEGRIDHGLHRSYVEREENLTAIRGRISFAADIRHNSVLRHRTYCEFSELTWDIPENQVIRQVVRLLSGWDFVSALRGRLRSIDATMHDVATGRFTASDVRRFRYSRFSADYEPLHRLCALFLEGASLSEDLGAIDSRTFLVDMNKLFERFVTNLLDERRPTGIVVSGQSSLHLDRERKISIIPDVLVREGGRTALVADCKYKQIAPDDFRNHDVYQVLAYCTATDCSEGLLLYPTAELGVARQTASIVNSGIRVAQLTVDLGVPRDALEAECDRFAAEVFGGQARLAQAPVENQNLSVVA